jgi:hypothetical protein
VESGGCRFDPCEDRGHRGLLDRFDQPSFGLLPHVLGASVSSATGCMLIDEDTLQLLFPKRMARRIHVGGLTFWSPSHLQMVVFGAGILVSGAVHKEVTNEATRRAISTSF